MICKRTHPLAMLCEDCKNKWIVDSVSEKGDLMFFCFDTESEAKECFNEIEKTNQYKGNKLKKNNSRLLPPKEV